VGDKTENCSCLSCRRLNDGHPDFFIAGNRGRIKVEDIGLFFDFISSQPFLSSLNVSIFNNAEDMTWEASNKLLKALEEHSNHYFFLITANLERVIPTVRSRCFHFKFDPLRSDDLTNILWKKLGFELPKAKVLGWLGSQGNIDVFKDPSTLLETRASVFSLFPQIVKKETCQVLDFIDRYPSESGALLDIFLLLLTDMLLIKNGLDSEIVNKDMEDDLKKFCEKTDYKFLIVLGNMFNSIKEHKHLNIDLSSRMKNNTMKMELVG